MDTTISKEETIQVIDDLSPAMFTLALDIYVNQTYPELARFGIADERSVRALERRGLIAQHDEGFYRLTDKGLAAFDLWYRYKGVG